MAAPTRAELDEMDLILRGYQVSRMLRLVADLDIPDRIGPGATVALDALARACGVRPRPLLRVLRALAAFGIFAVDQHGRIEHTPRSRLLRSDMPNSLHHAARFWTTPGTWAAWDKLDAAMDGRVPQVAAWDMPHFDYLRQHPHEAGIFNAMMAHMPDDRHAAIAAGYDFSGTKLIVDLGGGTGAALRHILRRVPGARGLILERAEVVAALTSEDLLQGWIEAQSGSFFDAVPAGADVYLLIRILHDWDDVAALRILRTCRTAIGPHAVLLVGELILEPDPAHGRPADYLVDVQMMAMYGDAGERTADEFRALFAQAGFQLRRIIPTASPLSILEAIPAL